MGYTYSVHITCTSHLSEQGIAHP